MASKKYSTRTSRSNGLLKNPLMWIGLLAVLGVVVAILELTNTTYIFHKKPTPAVIPVEPSNTPTDNNQSVDKQTSTPTTKDAGSQSSTNKSTNGSTTLTSPYGDFVSNHHPNLDGKPNPSSITSVCNTTPGATCSIRFDMGSTSTSLPSKTADSKGAAIWTWDVKKANLTTGDWTVTAVASLNGQTKSTKDQLVMSVGP